MHFFPFKFDDAEALGMLVATVLAGTVVVVVVVVANVPYDLEIGGIKIGNWVSAQKACYRKKKLDKRRANLLSQIAGWNWAKQKSGPKTKRAH